MKINTKVLFEWNDKSKQYEEVYCESYEYDGKVDQCQGSGMPWAWDQALGGGSMYQGFRLSGQMTPRGFQGGMYGQGGGTQGDYGQNFGGWLGQRNAGVDPTQNILSQYQGGGSMNFFQNPLLQSWDQSKGGGISGINRLLLPIGKPITPEPYTSPDIPEWEPALQKAIMNTRPDEFAPQDLRTTQSELLSPLAEDRGSVPGARPNLLQRMGLKYKRGGWGGKAPSSEALKSYFVGSQPEVETAEMLGDITGMGMPSSTFKPLAGVEAGKKLPEAAAKKGAEGFFGSAAAQGGMMAGGALLGGITGYMQAKSQKKGLSAAIGELDPIKTQAFGAYEKMGGIAESYRPGGTYSRYMGGKILSQAEESVGQETSRMIASGITSPSMMRQIGIQSRRQAQTSLPGMEMQVSQMALPYEQLASGYFSEYKGLGEQMAGLKGARSAINPWSSALSGAMSGAMGAATMIGSLASDRRMKKDIKYLHTSNEGHKVYSFKYKDGDTKYSGVMAQDVLKINPNAVTLKNGMLAVYYDMIDVDMQQLDII